MRLEMHVHFGGTEEVFSNDELLVEPIGINRTASDDLIEQDDVQVTTPSVTGNADFFDLDSSITTFGQGRYMRVKLQNPGTGETVFNGICYPEDIDYDDKTKTYKWTLLGGKDEMMRRLRQVYLLDLWSGYPTPDPITAYSLRIYKQRRSVLANDEIETTGYSQDVQEFYDSIDIARYVADTAYELNAQLPGENYFQRIQYDVGNGVETYERPVSLIMWSGYPPGDSKTGGQNVGDLWPQNDEPPFLPPWKGDRFFETLAAMSGWRLQPSFRPYPSDTIDVNARRLRWEADQVVSPLAIDQYELADAHGLYRDEPDSEGVSVQNEVGESSPLQKPARFYPPSSSETNRFDLRVPGIGAAAARRWEAEIADPNEGDPRSLKGNVSQVDVRIPGVLHEPGMSSNDSYGDYDETVYYGYPIVANEGGICYVTSLLGGDKGFEDNRVVYLREVQDPAAEQRSVIAEHWADAMYEAREWLHQRRQVLEGAYTRPPASASDVAVGDLQDSAVAALGKRWSAEKISEDLDQDSWEVEFERPDEDGAIPALPDNINRILNARSRITEIQLLSGDKREVAVVQWDPPGAAWCRAVEYEVEHQFNGSGYQAYRYSPTFATYAVIETERIYGTTFDPTDNLDVQIRAVGLDGAMSDWATHTVRKV